MMCKECFCMTGSVHCLCTSWFFCNSAIKICPKGALRILLPHKGRVPGRTMERTGTWPGWPRCYWVIQEEKAAHLTFSQSRYIWYKYPWICFKKACLDAGSALTWKYSSLACLTLWNLKRNKKLFWILKKIKALGIHTGNMLWCVPSWCLMTLSIILDQAIQQNQMGYVPESS